MWLRDTGTLERLNNVILRPPELIPEPKVRRNQPLILRQLGIIMIVLVAGLKLGTIIFLVEVLIKTRARRVPKANDGNEKKTQSNHAPAEEILAEMVTKRPNINEGQ